MAGADYLCCEVCGKRTIYIGNLPDRERGIELKTICEDCTSKNTLVVVKIRKMKKGKHYDKI